MLLDCKLYINGSNCFFQILRQKDIKRNNYYNIKYDIRSSGYPSIDDYNYPRHIYLRGCCYNRDLNISYRSKSCYNDIKKRLIGWAKEFNINLIIREEDGIIKERVQIPTRTELIKKEWEKRKKVGVKNVN